MATIKYKGFTIDTELGDDQRVDITITKTLRSEEYIDSIGAAEHEGLIKEIQIPIEVINKAYDLDLDLFIVTGKKA
jgi:hypothetical protein